MNESVRQVLVVDSAKVDDDSQIVPMVSLESALVKI